MSTRRTTTYIGLIAAVIGLITACVGILQVIPFPDPLPNPSPGGGLDSDPFEGCHPADLTPALQLSDGKAPSETVVTVSGTGFCPDEQVEIFFGTDQIQRAQTDADGSFSVDARIPGTLDFAAPMQVDIRARGQSGGFARTPFELTSR